MRNRRLHLKLLSLILATLPIAAFARKIPAEVHVYLHLTGSTPPVAEWYSCAKNLHGKPFDQQETDRCLQSILSHPQFTAGKVVVKHRRAFTSISFILEAPPLKLAKLDYDFSTGLALDFEDFIAQDDDVLRVGEVYDSHREIQTQIRLEEFLRTRGIVGIISEEVALDYEGKTATVVVKLWTGPNVAPEELLLPNPRKCDAYVGNVNEIDVDDNTPLPLVDAILGISRTICFSPDALHKAEQELNKTELFSLVQIDVGRSGQWANLSLKVRTKPTRVGHIVLKWYGTFSETHVTQMPTISLAENDFYSRSLALRSQDDLVDLFKKPGLKMKVTEEDAMEPDGRLTVVFHILGAKTDAVSIDGKDIQSGE